MNSIDELRKTAIQTLLEVCASGEAKPSELVSAARALLAVAPEEESGENMPKVVVIFEGEKAEEAK